VVCEVSFDEAVSRPRIVRGGKFRFGKRFGEPEKFRFPPPIGEATVVLAAQDEVGTVPHFLPLKEMDVKIGGNEIDRLRRWYRQGKLSRSAGLVASRFPKTSSPRQVARLIRKGVLQNARFAAAVVVRGVKKDQQIEVRCDALFPSLYQIRQRGLALSPVSYATAQMAALFIKHFPRESAGVFSSRSASLGKPAGHPERLALARHSSDAESYAEETVDDERIFRSEPAARRGLFVVRRYNTTALAAFFGGLLGNAQDLHMHGAFARAIQLGQNDGLPISPASTRHCARGLKACGPEP